MYDISQLNDMLVPELKDIADHLNIPHANKTEKKDLIDLILTGQSNGEPKEKATTAERPKRKRIAKASATDAIASETDTPVANDKNKSVNETEANATNENVAEII